MSPALAGGFFATEPPGKPSSLSENVQILTDRVTALLPDSSLERGLS